jgi:hypothetical protein
MPRVTKTPALAADDRRTIEEIAVALRSRWPVEALILYGSKARGDDTPESDIDLLVLTARPLAPEEIGGMRALVRRIGLAHGTWPELYIRTSEEWWHGVYQAVPLAPALNGDD